MIKYNVPIKELFFTNQFSDADGDDIAFSAFKLDELNNPKPLPNWIELDITDKKIVVKPLEKYIG